MDFNPLSLREWVVLLLLVLSHIGRSWGGWRKDRRDERTALTVEMTRHFNTIEGSWKSTFDELQRRIKRAEESERRCEERCAKLEALNFDSVARIGDLEEALEELRRQLHSKNEEMSVLLLEHGIRSVKDRRKRDRPNGGTPRRQG